MDIRSFFGKKPAKKNSVTIGRNNAVAAADESRSKSKSSKEDKKEKVSTISTTTSTNSAKAVSSTTNKATHTIRKLNKKNDDDDKSVQDKMNNKKKRKVVIDDDDDDDDDEEEDMRKEEIVEISPQDFFATTTKPTSKGKSRTSSSSKNDDNSNTKNTRDSSDDDDDDDDDFGSPTKRIRSSSRHASPRRRTSSTAAKIATEIVVEDGRKNKNNKRRILDEDDEDDDYDNSSNDVDNDDDCKDDSYVLVDDQDDSDDDDDYENETKKSRRSNKSIRKSPSSTTKKPSPKPSKTTSPTKRARKSPASSSVSSAAKAKAKTKNKMVLLEPVEKRDAFDIDTDIKVSECMAGVTFVFTGNMDELGRDDAIDLVKILGGRVTGAVSGKTNYLVVGAVLEDGRDYKEGSKYRKAIAGGDDKIKLVMGEKYLYGLCHAYHEKAMKENGIDNSSNDVEKEKKVVPKDGACRSSTTTPSTGMPNPYAKKTTGGSSSAVLNPYTKNKGPVISNPYAKNKGPISNPYAKNNKGPSGVSNPYAKKSNGPTSTSSSSSTDFTVAKTKGDKMNSLWVDRYKPNHTREILGNKTNVKKLQDWLRTWEKVFNNSKNSNKTYNNPRGPLKAALLSGPPGIGKTTTAYLVAKEDGRDVLEFNASDVRSKKALQSAIGDLTGSQGISFANMKTKGTNTIKSKAKPSILRRCVIMDEVDGMGAGDRSGMSELIQMIKKSKTPIICICNDRQSQKMKSLLPYCMDLRYSRPTKNVLANRAIRIAETEGLSVERNAAEAIAESCGNDVRQVINLLQMWAQKKDYGGDGDDGGGEGEGGSTSLTYKKFKDRGRSIQKDEMLRVNLFDAAKLIVEGPRDLSQADNKAKLSSLMKRNDAYFVDYSFVGLIVQQNYPKVVQSQYLRVKQKGDAVEEQHILERLHQASASMSDYDLAESQIRGGDLNWSLLPTAAILTIKTGYHAGGESGGFLGGFPEFTSWMGKNSSMGKNYRLLNELSHHMNYKVSANAQELRQSYIPVLRDRIYKLLKNGDADSNKEVIAFMDEYGLSRDDIADKLDVLVLGKKEVSFDDLNSKQKAAFTREYNSGVHKSQALVREQGGGEGKKKGKNKAVDEDDEDGVEADSSEDEVDVEKELEKLAAQFKKKGRKKKVTTKKKGKGKK
mmetsp:Transcript_49385/g.55895  ORF Transcript_49385/g.55895 Transcript_49385/m.55895 type:complete len:1157 (+) Transcript_49385:190-3660(+)